MAINKEVEVKTLLSKENYNKIINYFNFDLETQIKQTNYYFDTSDLLFQRSRIAFRVRHLHNNNTYEMTAKLRQRDGSSIELNQDISYFEFFNLLTTGKIPDGLVNEKLSLFLKLTRLNHIASLTTYRYEVKYDDGLLAIDENHYANIIDYELECEGESMAQCATIIKNLLNSMDIDFIENKMGKRARAFQATRELKEKK